MKSPLQGVKDWDRSSFHRFVEPGEHGLDRGEIDPTAGWNSLERGE